MSAPNPPSPSELADALLGRCDFPPPGTPLTCAVSGGPDSLALLYLATRAGCRVTAVHVDHGLRPGSAAEAGIVERAAARFGAAFRAERVDVAPGPNLEARARDARRAAVGVNAATGHTADDQAETVLANLLRGAGVDGLAGMRHGPRHPILRLRRSETRALCEGLGMVPVDDPMNRAPRFLRTSVRSRLLPLMNELAGRDVVPVLARQAELLAGDADVLAEVAGLVDATDARALAGAPAPVGRRTVRRWLAGLGPHPRSSAEIERVLAVARGDVVATELAGGVRVSRSRGRMSAAPSLSGAGAGSVLPGADPAEPPADHSEMPGRSGPLLRYSRPVPNGPIVRAGDQG